MKIGNLFLFRFLSFFIILFAHFPFVCAVFMWVDLKTNKTDIFYDKLTILIILLFFYLDIKT